MWNMDMSFRNKEGELNMILIDSNIINVFKRDQKQMESFCKKVKESGDIVFVAPQVLIEIAGPKCGSDEHSIKRLETLKSLRKKTKTKFKKLNLTTLSNTYK